MRNIGFLTIIVLFALLLGSSLFVPGCKSDSTTGPTAGTTPITEDLFPLVLGHQFVYAGYAISTSGVALPDPSSVYRTVWTVGPSGPYPNSRVLIDSTTFQHPTYGVVAAARTLLVRKDSATKDFEFLQTLGPFFRAFSITPAGRTDTLRWISVAKPSVGLGGTWTAFDSTYTDILGSSVRLQIFGEMEAKEAVTDSSAAHQGYSCYRSRTFRRISVDDAIIVDNATTSRLWLTADVGPIQMLIAQDTENLGHFRVMKSRNF